MAKWKLTLVVAEVKFQVWEEFVEAMEMDSKRFWQTVSWFGEGVGLHQCYLQQGWRAVDLNWRHSSAVKTIL